MKILWIVFFVIIGLLAGSTLLVYEQNKILWFDPRSFWFCNVLIPLLTNMAAAYTVILLGYNQILKGLEQRERRRALGKVIDFWRLPGKSTQCFIVFGGDPPTMEDDKELRSSHATFFSIFALREALKKVHGDRINIVEKAASDLPLNWEGLEDANVIILGGYLSIDRMEYVQDKLQLTFVQDFSDKNERQIKRKVGKGEQYTSDIKDKKISRDFAIVTRIFDKRRNRTIFWFSGNYGIGTFASVLFFTTPEFLERDVSVDATKLTQFIVHVDGIVDNKIDQSHRDIELVKEKPFNLNPDEFRSAFFGEEVVAWLKKRKAGIGDAQTNAKNNIH